MGYVTHRDGRWYAVSYEGLDPLTGRDRRRWHRVADEADARKLADALPSARPPGPGCSRCRDTCRLAGSRSAKAGCDQPRRSATRR